MHFKYNKNKFLQIMMVVCIFSLMVMVYSLVSRNESTKSEFTPPPFDSKTVTGIPKVPSELGWSELDAQAFRVGVCGVVTIIGDKADIWLSNPKSNTVWLKARILNDDETVFGETGLIKPGEYVQSVKFDIVPESGTSIRIKMMAYQPETYFSEGSVILNTVVKEKK